MTSYRIFDYGVTLCFGCDFASKPKVLNFLTRLSVRGVAPRTPSVTSLHSALVTEHGQLYTWGHSGHGQTGQSTREVIATPRRLPSTAWEGRAAKEARRYARPTYHAR